MKRPKPFEILMSGEGGEDRPSYLKVEDKIRVFGSAVH